MRLCLVGGGSACDSDVCCLQDKDGSSPAALAAAGGQVECVARILDSTATLADSRLTALHLAVQVSAAYTIFVHIFHR